MRITLLFLLSCTFHNENFYTTEGHETREPKQDKETDGEGSRPQTVKWLREDQVSSACVGTGDLKHNKLKKNNEKAEQYYTMKEQT